VLKENIKLMVFERKILRRIYGPTTEREKGMVGGGLNQTKN
jgi:hypothetical protein